MSGLKLMFNFLVFLILIKFIIKHVTVYIKRKQMKKSNQMIYNTYIFVNSIKC